MRRPALLGAAVLGLLVLAGGFVLFVRWFLEVQDLARRASCRPHLMYVECQEYASEHDGLFPPLAPERGRFTFDTRVTKLRFDLSNHICEFDAQGPLEWQVANVADPQALDDWSYAYLGYFLENEQQGLAFLEAYEQAKEGDREFDRDIVVGEGHGNCGSDILYRLRTPKDLPPEVACVKDRMSAIPVIIEWPGNHRYMGGKVVFLDGSSRYIEYPGEFPMTRRFVEGLRAIDRAGAKTRP